MSTWIGSPNYTEGRGGYRVLGVIIHWMAGNLASTDSVFQDRNRNTSATYGVEDGNVHQYVKEENTAYHAGNWIVNQQTIGIEHSAQPGRAASDATYEASAQLIAAAAKRWGFAVNSSTVRPHSAIVATACPGTMDVGRLIRRANEIIGGATPAPTPTPAPEPTAYPLATVVVDTLNVRAQPNTSAELAGSKTLKMGKTFEYVGLVEGQSVSGISTWIKSTLGNFVWAGGTNIATTPPLAPVPAPAQGGTAKAIRPANVRTAPNTNAPLGGSLLLAVGKTFTYSAKVTGQQVSQNGVTSNIWYHSTAGNYVWGGNLQDI